MPGSSLKLTVPGCVAEAEPLVTGTVSHAAPGCTLAVQLTVAEPETSTRKELRGPFGVPPDNAWNCSPAGWSDTLGEPAMKTETGTVATPVEAMTVMVVR